MNSTLSLVLAIVCAVGGLVFTYVNLQRPDIGMFHWIVVVLIFAGAFLNFRKYEKSRG